ncbi:hypothetical protein H310_08284 [Aphanomyces invadans]|uniref:Uncharacterized protein n=1 Tax=Aphanomyces invadans TaxID=157072 RepID=A0A024TZN6_9STRA|nr:hypothetical protein H310_08284 [Aphanomyces invadans]ETV99640.1 hypothetical protein H310_08284 [Aphanomyces invadans]|eukprot:XP_008872196.1 hypothetical protein H310_08284 [Aphanomyces invadans]
MDTHDVPAFPRRHHILVMQEKTWMESNVSRDNIFESHVSKVGIDTAALLGYALSPLPPHVTSHCQPLDVSIIAPFKRHLCDLWIADDMNDNE